MLDVVYADVADRRWPAPPPATGTTVVSGLDMLVHQAAEQFRLFTGAPAPVDAMHAAGRQALDR